MEKLNVAVADDNEDTLKMLNEMIRQEEGLELVGSANNGEDAYSMIKKNKTGCSAVRSGYA